MAFSILHSRSSTLSFQFPATVIFEIFTVGATMRLRISRSLPTISMFWDGKGDRLLFSLTYDLAEE